MYIVLGNTGYVGSKILHHLKENGWEAVGISRAALDYTNPKTLKEFLQSKKPEFLIKSI